MPSLKDLKTRIASVTSTRKITKAMQMVAAAKLRRAQDAAEAARPYAERFNAVVSALAASVGQSDNVPLLSGNGSDQTHLLVVMTAERGLCGGFNSSIVKMVRQAVQKLQAEGKTVKILTVGKKGREQLRRDYADLFVDHVDLSGVKRIDYATAREIGQDLLKRFAAGEFDVAKIFYSQFQSVIAQIPTEQQVIPAKFEMAEDAVVADYEYEPSEEAILEDLLPASVSTAIFSALLENAASEQGARMSAMDNATRNAGEMIDKLTIEFNRSRQAVITNELIEIISGAEAL